MGLAPTTILGESELWLGGNGNKDSAACNPALADRSVAVKEGHVWSAP